MKRFRSFYVLESTELSIPVLFILNNEFIFGLKKWKYSKTKIWVDNSFFSLWSYLNASQCQPQGNSLLNFKLYWKIYRVTLGVNILISSRHFITPNGAYAVPPLAAVLLGHYSQKPLQHHSDACGCLSSVHSESPADGKCVLHSGDTLE